MKVFETDCLVIGAGLAGSAYALRAASAGLSVELLSLGGKGEGSSNWAQGGIVYETDDPASLARDIMSASGFTANPAAVEQLVRAGAPAVKSLLLDELRVPFDREGGALHLTREGGHSRPRIIHAGDSTGAAIQRAISARIDCTPGVFRRRGFAAVDLMTAERDATDRRPGGQPACFGCYALDVGSGDVVAFVARKTVLATGGLSRIFRHGTNPPGSVGHGVAMASRIGARLQDLEYVQFHPTVFSSETTAPFLITEALRGEGAVLVNASGRRFVDDVHAMGSLAPRDVVARALHDEMHRTGASCMFLDVSAIRPEVLTRRFPLFLSQCRAAGVDPLKQWIPVAPAAHFSCGGIQTDLQGRTSVPNLNAIGETACTGLHGANRLASTSLLECIVSANATADADAVALERNFGAHLRPRPWRRSVRPGDATGLLEAVQEIMTRAAGVVREPAILASAKSRLVQLRRETEEKFHDSHSTLSLIEARNAVETALAVVSRALCNRSSKGCHSVVGSELPAR